MNVLIATRYFNNENGGMGLYSERILKGMLDRHKVFPVGTLSKGMEGYFWYSFSELYRKMKMSSIVEDIDVFHALTPMESVWMPKERTVTTVHDLFPLYDVETHYKSNFLSSKISEKAFDFAMKKAIESKRIIAVSEFTKRDILSRYEVKESKIVVVRHGINENLEPVETEHENYRVGTLSYLGPRKRIDILIDAFKELDDENAQLLIPSTGKSRSYLEKYAHDDKRIEFLGYLSEEDKSEFLSSLDVFVITSKLEGYCLPLVEAMACRTPVVTLEDSLMPSDVKSKSHRVSKGNLAKLLSGKEFDCDIEENYRFAKSHKWDECIEETNKIYEMIAK